MKKLLSSILTLSLLMGGIVSVSAATPQSPASSTVTDKQNDSTKIDAHAKKKHKKQHKKKHKKQPKQGA